MKKGEEKTKGRRERERKRERRERDKHLGTEGSQGEGPRLGLREGEPD